MRGPNGFGSEGRRELAPTYVGVSAVFESRQTSVSCAFISDAIGFNSVRTSFFFLLVCGYEDKHARAHTHTHPPTHPRERETDRQAYRQRSEFYYTKIKSLGTCLFLQSIPANLHASRLHIEHQYAKH